MSLKYATSFKKMLNKFECSCIFQGNILDDEELIETLDSSKKTSAVISERVKEAVKVETKINETREE